MTYLPEPVPWDGELDPTLERVDSECADEDSAL